MAEVLPSWGQTGKRAATKQTPTPETGVRPQQRAKTRHVLPDTRSHSSLGLQAAEAQQMGSNLPGALVAGAEPTAQANAHTAGTAAQPLHVESNAKTGGQAAGQRSQRASRLDRMHPHASQPSQNQLPGDDPGAATSTHRFSSTPALDAHPLPAEQLPAPSHMQAAHAHAAGKEPVQAGRSSDVVKRKRGRPPQQRAEPIPASASSEAPASPAGHAAVSGDKGVMQRTAGPGRPSKKHRAGSASATPVMAPAPLANAGAASAAAGSTVAVIRPAPLAEAAAGGPSSPPSAAAQQLPMHQRRFTRSQADKGGPSQCEGPALTTDVRAAEPNSRVAIGQQQNLQGVVRSLRSLSAGGSVERGSRQPQQLDSTYQAPFAIPADHGTSEQQAVGPRRSVRTASHAAPAGAAPRARGAVGQQQELREVLAELKSLAAGGVDRLGIRQRRRLNRSRQAIFVTAAEPTTRERKQALLAGSQQARVPAPTAVNVREARTAGGDADHAVVVSQRATAVMASQRAEPAAVQTGRKPADQPAAGGLADGRQPAAKPQQPVTGGQAALRSPQGDIAASGQLPQVTVQLQRLQSQLQRPTASGQPQPQQVRDNAATAVATQAAGLGQGAIGHMHMGPDAAQPAGSAPCPAAIEMPTSASAAAPHACATAKDASAAHTALASSADAALDVDAPAKVTAAHNTVGGLPSSSAAATGTAIVSHATDKHRAACANGNLPSSAAGGDAAACQAHVAEDAAFPNNNLPISAAEGEPRPPQAHSLEDAAYAAWHLPLTAGGAAGTSRQLAAKDAADANRGAHSCAAGAPAGPSQVAQQEVYTSARTRSYQPQPHRPSAPQVDRHSHCRMERGLAVQSCVRAAGGVPPRAQPAAVVQHGGQPHAAAQQRIIEAAQPAANQPPHLATSQGASPSPAAPISVQLHGLGPLVAANQVPEVQPGAPSVAAGADSHSRTAAEQLEAAAEQPAGLSDQQTADNAAMKVSSLAQPASRVSPLAPPASMEAMQVDQQAAADVQRVKAHDGLAGNATPHGNSELPGVGPRRSMRGCSAASSNQLGLSPGLQPAATNRAGSKPRKQRAPMYCSGRLLHGRRLAATAEQNAARDADAGPSNGSAPAPAGPSASAALTAAESSISAASAPAKLSTTPGVQRVCCLAVWREMVAQTKRGMSQTSARRAHATAKSAVKSAAKSAAKLAAASCSGSSTQSAAQRRPQGQAQQRSAASGEAQAALRKEAAEQATKAESLSELATEYATRAAADAADATARRARAKAYRVARLGTVPEATAAGNRLQQGGDDYCFISPLYHQATAAAVGSNSSVHAKRKRTAFDWGPLESKRARCAMQQEQQQQQEAPVTSSEPPNQLTEECVREELLREPRPAVVFPSGSGLTPGTIASTPVQSGPSAPLPRNPTPPLQNASASVPSNPSQAAARPPSSQQPRNASRAACGRFRGQPLVTGPSELCDSSVEVSTFELADGCASGSAMNHPIAAPASADEQQQLENGQLTDRHKPGVATNDPTATPASAEEQQQLEKPQLVAGEAPGPARRLSAASPTGTEEQAQPPPQQQPSDRVPEQPGAALAPCSSHPAAQPGDGEQRPPQQQRAAESPVVRSPEPHPEPGLGQAATSMLQAIEPQTEPSLDQADHARQAMLQIGHMLSQLHSQPDSRPASRLAGHDADSDGESDQQQSRCKAAGSVRQSAGGTGGRAEVRGGRGRGNHGYAAVWEFPPDEAVCPAEANGQLGAAETVAAGHMQPVTDAAIAAEQECPGASGDLGTSGQLPAARVSAPTLISAGEGAANLAAQHQVAAGPGSEGLGAFGADAQPAAAEGTATGHQQAADLMANGCASDQLAPARSLSAKGGDGSQSMDVEPNASRYQLAPAESLSAGGGDGSQSIDADQDQLAPTRSLSAGGGDGQSMAANQDQLAPAKSLSAGGGDGRQSMAAGEHLALDQLAGANWMSANGHSSSRSLDAAPSGSFCTTAIPGNEQPCDAGDTATSARDAEPGAASGHAEHAQHAEHGQAAVTSPAKQPEMIGDHPVYLAAHADASANAAVSPADANVVPGDTAADVRSVEPGDRPRAEAAGAQKAATDALAACLVEALPDTGAALEPAGAAAFVQTSTASGSRSPALAADAPEQGDAPPDADTCQLAGAPDMAIWGDATFAASADVAAEAQTLQPAAETAAAAIVGATLAAQQAATATTCAIEQPVSASLLNPTPTREASVLPTQPAATAASRALAELVLVPATAAVGSAASEGRLGLRRRQGLRRCNSATALGGSLLVRQAQHLLRPLEGAPLPFAGARLHHAAAGLQPPEARPGLPALPVEQPLQAAQADGSQAHQLPQPDAAGGLPCQQVDEAGRMHCHQTPQPPAAAGVPLQQAPKDARPQTQPLPQAGAAGGFPSPCKTGPAGPGSRPAPHPRDSAMDLAVSRGPAARLAPGLLTGPGEDDGCGMAVRPAGSADQEGSLTQRAAYGAGHIQIHNGIAYFSALHAPDLASADAHTVGGQTRQVVRLLEAKLQQHGCSKEQLLTVTVTLKDMPGAEQAFGESWGSWTDMPATHILVGACGKDVLVAISGAFCLPPAK